MQTLSQRRFFPMYYAGGVADVTPEFIRGCGCDALLLDIDNTVGLVKAGLNADLLVCDGDASADIRSLQRVRRVLMSGKTVYRPEAPEC